MEMKQLTMKVTGMVHSSESGAVDGLGSCLYCLSFKAVKCGKSILATIQIFWAMETNKSRERTVDDVLEEALRYRGFWGEKRGEYCQWWRSPLCRLT